MARKQRNNCGSVYKDVERNQYRAIITLPDGGRISKRFDGPDDAEEWRAEQVDKLYKGKFVKPSDLTLQNWLIKFLSVYKKGNIRERSFDRDISIAKHCKPLADYYIQDLLASDFQSLLNDMKANGFSGETRKKVYNLLNSALTQARIEKVIEINPMESVKAPTVTREEVITFTVEELKRIKEEAKGHRLYPFLLLAETTGMRLSELMGLRWNDVDFTNKCLYVRQVVQRGRNGFVLEDPKSKSSKRKITLPAETLAILKDKYDNSIRKLYPDKFGDLCFTSEADTPLDPNNFERWWRNIQKKTHPEYQKLEKAKAELKKKGVKVSHPDYKNLVDLQKRIPHKKFHALRHTHASLLLANNVPLIDVSRRLGHAKPSITLDLYGHAMPDHDNIIAGKVSAIYSL